MDNYPLIISVTPSYLELCIKQVGKLSGETTLFFSSVLPFSTGVNFYREESSPDGEKIFLLNSRLGFEMALFSVSHKSCSPL